MVGLLYFIGNDEFNHLTINLTLPLTCGPKLPLIKWGPNKWEFSTAIDFLTSS